MTSQTPKTPDPSRTTALLKNTWVKITHATSSMISEGFTVGEIVQIRDVTDANRTPNKWQGLISDTQYAIHRKVVEMVETLVISPAEGMHLIPHRLLREQRGGTTPPPTRLVHQQVACLSGERSYPLGGKTMVIRKWTKVTIYTGPKSTKGTDTSNKSDPNLWNYQVTFGDPVRKVGVNKFSPWVSAENFSAVAETRPPPDPR